MRRYKAAAVILLVVSVLIFGAYIPILTTYIIDQCYEGDANLNSMASLKLNIRQELPLFGKLAMLSQMDFNIEIDDDKADMTREQVKEAAYNGIEAYIDAQLITASENDVQMRPLLVQVQDDSELQGVVWSVMIIGANSSFVDLVIDDDTGKILRIQYAADNPSKTVSNEEALDMFADIFFAQLGIKDYWNFLVDDLESVYVGDNANAVRFRFGDKLYGEVNIDLYVHDYGFYIEFPSIV